MNDRVKIQEIQSLETLTCSVVTERLDDKTEKFVDFEEMSYWAKGSLKWAIRKALKVEGNINIYTGVELYCTLKLVHQTKETERFFTVVDECGYSKSYNQEYILITEEDSKLKFYFYLPYKYGGYHKVEF